MSKEMREQINRVKNWKQFLNENTTEKNILYFHSRGAEIKCDGHTFKIEYRENEYGEVINPKEKKIYSAMITKKDGVSIVGNDDIFGSLEPHEDGVNDIYGFTFKEIEDQILFYLNSDSLYVQIKDGYGKTLYSYLLKKDETIVDFK
jgi:hypothetical protein